MTIKTKASQKRALFFVFDGGTGIGHLRRLATIASRLQGRFSCLIVTGHRAAAHWFVPDECEYVHLPSWDSLIEAKARYWSRKPFVEMDKSAAVRLRKHILNGIVRGYQPDVIFVDHLPLGAEEELSAIIKTTRCHKYFVTRGVLNETEDLRHLILGAKADDYLRRYYHKVLVASDSRVFDFSRQYNIAAEIREKTFHTGYVAASVSRDAIDRTRKNRGLKEGDIWVVASAGGGQFGEKLIEGCLELAREHRNINFDIVVGPRSNLHWTDRHQTVITTERLHLHKEAPQLSILHASADLVISSGGYNSLLEILQGSAKILCFPLRKDQRDEQYQHATRLKKFVDIEISTQLSELRALFEQAIRSQLQKRTDRRSELNFNGTANIEQIVLEDLAGEV